MPNFAAGGVAIPADAALAMKLGAEAVFVGSGIFEVGDASRPKEARARRRPGWRGRRAGRRELGPPDVLVEISTGLPQAMRGISLETLTEDQHLAKRGW